MEFIKLSHPTKQNIRCQVCALPLVVADVLMNEMHAVVDVLETTTNEDTERTYIPLLPPFYFCSEHARENQIYYLGDKK